MKKTTYVIIGAILIVFALGIGLAAYIGVTSTNTPPQLENVENALIEDVN